MKVRIGYGLGTRASSDPDRFAALVTGLEARRFDSLWLSERVTGDCPDPIVGLGVAAGLTTKIKFGFSVLVVPGPQPDAARQGAGHARPAEPRPAAPRLRARRARPRRAPGLRRGAGRPGEALQRGAPAPAPLLGRRDGGPRRRRVPLRGRRRCGRCPSRSRSTSGSAASRRPSCGAAAASATGGCPSFCTPEDVRDGIVAIQGHAAEADREIDPEHFGALIPYCDGPIPDVVAAAVAHRRPGVEPERMIASGLDGLRTMIGEHIDVGASKFVVIPLVRARRLGRPPRRGRRRAPAAADLSTVGRPRARGIQMKFGVMFANIGPMAFAEGAIGIAQAAEGRRHRVPLDGRAHGRAGRLPVRLPVQPTGRMPGPDDSPIPDPLIWLAYVAAATSTIRLATGILILPQRNPVTLAKEVATLDQLSGGRVELGVGRGVARGGVRRHRRAVRRARPAHRRAHRGAARRSWTQSPATYRGPLRRASRTCTRSPAGAAHDPDPRRRPLEGGRPPGRAARRRVLPRARQP